MTHKLQQSPIEAVICSHNENKIRELALMFPGFNLRILDPTDELPPEDGATIEDNARIKVIAGQAFHPNTWVIADDSGIEVYALDMAPGVISARYAGDHDDDANNELLLKNLQHHEDRRARFVCVLMAISPTGQELIARGEVEGVILKAPRGDNGFAYDKLFLPDGYAQTFAELPSDLKNKISHRAVAAQMLREKILANID